MESDESINDGTLVDSWMLMQSPVQLLFVVVLYLYFVLKLGPQLMERRAPFQLKAVLIAYNAYQVLFSTWLCSRLFFTENAVEVLTMCDYTKLLKSQEDQVAAAAWWYFFSKVVELLDTVFFVLRKKQSQVTFLHVYHHTLVVSFSWIYVKYLPNGQGILVGFINTFVHIVMYFYYLMAALKPQKHLWWKKYVTWLQLIQFYIGIPIIIYMVVMDCNMPTTLVYFYVFNLIFFIYLFTDFYIKAYRNKTRITLNLDVKVK